jgi:hypothetical protein
MNFEAQLFSLAEHTGLQGIHHTATFHINGIGEMTTIIPEDAYQQLRAAMLSTLLQGHQVSVPDQSRPQQDRIFGEDGPTSGTSLAEPARPMVADLVDLKKRVAAKAEAEEADDEDGVPQG